VFLLLRLRLLSLLYLVIDNLGWLACCCTSSSVKDKPFLILGSGARRLDFILKSVIRLLNDLMFLQLNLLVTGATSLAVVDDGMLGGG
jgi:hypothetical protein